MATLCPMKIMVKFRKTTIRDTIIYSFGKHRIRYSGDDDKMVLTKMAKKIAQLYAENQNVDAVLLGGSVSRGWQDEFSDIELLIFWKQPPTDEERKMTILELGGTILEFHPFEDEEWSETYTIQGVKLEISNFQTATIHRFLNATIQLFDTAPETQCIAAAIDHGLALSGEPVIADMKKQIETYPDELRQAMIAANIDFGGRWSNREALLHRRDWLMLYGVMADVETKIMSVLFGLNRQYVVHPGFKWQRKSLEGMTIKPEDIADRLESVFLGTPGDGVKELEAIIQELFDLIGREFPQSDLSDAKKQTERVRPRNHSQG